MSACLAPYSVLVLLLTVFSPVVRGQPQGTEDTPGSAAHESNVHAPSPSKGDAPSNSGDQSDEERAAQPVMKKSTWPQPVNDDEPYSFLLFDLLEYQRTSDVDGLRWDIVGWRGSDERRLWIKSEGVRYFVSDAGGQADLQLLYGRLISPFFDLQGGVRIEQHDERNAKPERAFLVVGLQGLAPYRFEVEPALFLSNKGKFSGRFTGTLDWYLTQRLILQPRLETEFAFQKDEAFGVESGVNDVDLGLRLRYEVTRQFAPYLGASYRHSFGATRDRIVREGGQSNVWLLTVGVRAWF